MADDEAKYSITPQGEAYVECMLANPDGDRGDYFNAAWQVRQAEIDRLTKELEEAGKAIKLGYQRRGELETRLDDVRAEIQAAHDLIGEFADLVRDDIVEDDVALEALVYDAIKRVISEREDARRWAVRLEGMRGAA